MHSAIYQGQVRHRRYAPRQREFRYRLFLLYLDLSEIPRLTSTGLCGWLHRLHIMRFERTDHLGNPEEPLEESVRTVVEQYLGRRPTGPVRLLTQPRHFGYVINPISLYYCFTEDDLQLDSVVAEVVNTPWQERHCYVLDCLDQPASGCYRERSVKQMHVSPFLPMEMEYRWKLTRPGRTLFVHLDDLLTATSLTAADDQVTPSAASGRLLDATLLLRRRPLTGSNLLQCLAMYPLMTVRIAVAIYFQALLLWWKRIPFHSHPSRVSTGRLSAVGRRAE